MIITPLLPDLMPIQTRIQKNHGKLGAYLFTLAMMPSKDWNFSLIEATIERNIIPDKRNCFGDTILHYYVILFKTYDDNFWKVITFLLKRNVNPYKMNHLGLTAEDLLIEGKPYHERLELSKKWSEAIKSHSPFQPKIEFSRSELYKLAYKIALYCKLYFFNNSSRFEELQIERYLSLLAEKCQKDPLEYLEETNNDYALDIIGKYLNQKEYEISLVRKAIIKIES